MAIASTKTLLPLDTFAKIIGISPLFFNQVELDLDDPTDRAAMQADPLCGFPIPQYDWQTGAGGCMSRDEIARTIADAETMLTEWLGYKPGVDWIVDDHVTYPRPANPNVYNMFGATPRGQWAQVRANFGYVQMGGVEAKTLIQAAAAVVYTDTNSDGYFETATIQVNTTVTAADEIAVYYPGHSGDAAWQVRPITVSIAGGVATIVCRREQLVIEDILEAFVAQAANGVDNNDFLPTVDVYRRYNDPSSQVSLRWQAGGWAGFCANCGDVDDGTCVACGSTIQAGCMAVQNSRLGLVAVQPATWDAVNGRFSLSYFGQCRAPDNLRLSYRAGAIDSSLPSPLITVPPVWARAISYLALSMMDRPLCACESIRAYTARWSEDLAASSQTQSGGTQTFNLYNDLLNNPFGTTRGAIYAWRLVQRNRLGEAAINA